ncbi:unnamed protein product [Lupinus luteus]|uniref:DUF674 family protein n=1 Tax=Lupinus luteus TaxID=3873 RepID=A0AAV1W370_LUPLU
MDRVREAGKDFVDVLLSFLTFPLGTIARIVSNDSNMKKVSVGCLSSLYQSVASLEVKHFWTDTCKGMLLGPRNSSEDYIRNIILNINDTDKTRYFICEDWECSRKESGGLLSLFRNKRCECGKLMNREILPQNALLISSEGSVSQPKDFGFKDYNAIKVISVNVTQKEIVEFFQISLLSNTPLRDFFLRREAFHENVSQRNNTIVLNNAKAEASDGEGSISLKVVTRKSKKKILFALAGDDFVDILLSFLTFPLGAVEDMLEGKSRLGSFDNLYKSILVLDPLKDFKSPNLKDNLVKSPLAQHFKLKKQILPIEEVPIVKYSCYSNRYYSDFSKGYLTTAQVYRNNDGNIISNPLTYVEPQSSTSKTGFVKKPSLFMVTDDLVVTPGSSMSVVSFLTSSGFSSSDLDEEVISIGKKECLSLLQASLISSSTLTDGLGQFIFPIKKQKIT